MQIRNDAIVSIDINVGHSNMKNIPCGSKLPILEKILDREVQGFSSQFQSVARRSEIFPDGVTGVAPYYKTLPSERVRSEEVDWSVVCAFSRKATNQFDPPREDIVYMSSKSVGGRWVVASEEPERVSSKAGYTFNGYSQNGVHFAGWQSDTSCAVVTARKLKGGRWVISYYPPPKKSTIFYENWFEMAVTGCDREEAEIRVALRRQ